MTNEEVKEEVEIKVLEDNEIKELKNKLDCLYAQKQTYVYALSTAIKEEDTEVISVASNALIIVIKQMKECKIKLRVCESQTKQE